MKKFYIVLIIFYFSILKGLCQFTISPNGALTPEQIVQNVLVGFGVQAFNVSINGSVPNAQIVNNSVFDFNYVGTGFPIQSGVLLQTQGAPSVLNDSDLLSLSGQPVTNGIILEFDFIPSGDTIFFKYLFASSEYSGYTCSYFNDVFGFFISGPGILGPYSNNSINLATVPGSNIPVAINTVNGGSPTGGYNAATCSQADPNWQANSVYFTTGYNSLFTSSAQISNYNGATIVLSANSDVVCNQTYHIKLAIANAVDQVLDSGVFLEAGSFASDAVEVSVATVSGDTTIVEGCTYADFIFTRPVGQTNDTLLINYTITGDAIEGTDYNFLPDTVIFLPGEDTVIVTLNPTQDGITEGFESVIITVEIINPCGDTIISSGTIYIGEGPIINITENDPFVQCATDSIPLFASASGGYAPYTYTWTDVGGGALGSGDTYTGAIFQNGTVSYVITATDACNFSGTDTVTITMNQTLAINTMTPTASSCVPTGAVSGSVIGATGIPSYNWSGPGANNPNFINASVWENIPSGWYYFSVSDNVCAVSDSVFVGEVAPPQAIFQLSQLSGCSPLQIVFTNNSLNSSSYFWDFGDGETYTSTNTNSVTHVFTNDQQNQDFIIQFIAFQSPFCSDTIQAGIITNVCGCTDNEAENYNPNATVDDGSCTYPDPIIIVPNVLTPNNDGINDIFELDWVNLTSLRLIILNRWGNVLYDQTSADLVTFVPAWNGKYENGEDAKDGIYFYKYEGKGISNELLEGHGFLHLIKNP